MILSFKALLCFFRLFFIGIGKNIRLKRITTKKGFRQEKQEILVYQRTINGKHQKRTIWFRIEKNNRNWLR